MLDLTQIKKDFPILNKETNERPLVFLDNASTSQKPYSVINAITEYYENFNANIHRGVYSISEKASVEYEKTREAVKEFINAKSVNEIIFTKNTTEAINIVAYSWATKNIEEGDEILISTNKGRVIRVAVKEIRTAGRNTQGVRIIKLSGEEKVVSAIKIDDNLI